MCLGLIWHCYLNPLLKTRVASNIVRTHGTYEVCIWWLFAQANLVGVVPLWLVFNIEHESVRYEEFQAWLVTASDGQGWRGRRTRRTTALSAGWSPHWRAGQKLFSYKGKQTSRGIRFCVSRGGGGWGQRAVATEIDSDNRKIRLLPSCRRNEKHSSSITNKATHPERERERRGAHNNSGRVFLEYAYAGNEKRYSTCRQSRLMWSVVLVNVAFWCKSIPTLNYLQVCGLEARGAA